MKITTIILILISSNIFAQSNYELIEKESYASCLTFIVVDEEGKEVTLPEKFKTVLDCPSLINITGNILTYEMNGVRQYNIDTKKEVLLFTNYDDIDGCSGPAWSEDKSKVMFVIINQERKHAYTASCRLIVLTFNKNGEVLQKQKFDRNIFFECGSICSSNPGEDFWFVNNKKIGFRMYNHETDIFSTEEIEID